MPADQRTFALKPNTGRGCWLRAFAFFLLSPLAAIPVTFILMLVVGDYLFPLSETSIGNTALPLLALKRTIGGLYITLIFVGEHYWVFGGLMIIVSGVFAFVTRRIQRIGHRVLLAVALGGLLFPAIFLLTEALNWDRGLFN